MPDFETSEGSNFAKSARETLAKAAPWITFLGVMSFVGAGFMVFGAVGMMIAPRFSDNMALGKVVGFVYLFASSLGFLTGTWSVRLAKNTRALSEAVNEETLGSFATIFKRIVLFFGITSIVAASLMIIGLAAAIVSASALRY